MAGEADIWQPRTILDLSADTKRITQKFTAISGQTFFTITDFSYVIGTGAVQVFKNGAYQVPGVDWVENSTTSFSLTIGAVAGDIVVAVGYAGITGTVDVRDTDIFLSNYQAIRDYAGTEVTVYVQGTTTAGDGGESFFQKFTGAAIGFYVDDGLNVIVPTGGDGSTGWVRAYNSISVDSIAALKILNPIILAGNTKVTAVKGYFNPGDGGGGTFYWDSTSVEADNGGTILQVAAVTTGRWKRLYSGALNVRWFGASGDVTKDATAIQACIDLIGRSTGVVTRGSIYFPAGPDYLLDTQLEIAQQAIYFFGDADTVIKWEGNNVSAMFRAIDSARCVWDTLVLLGKDASQPTAAIYLDEPVSSLVGTNENSRIINVQIGRRYAQEVGAAWGLQRGIWIGGASNTNNDTVFVTDTQIHDCATAGIAIDNAQSVWGNFTNLLIDTCGYGIFAGSSFQGTNLNFNRNTIADIHVFRDISVHVQGYSSEHAKLPISTAQGASLVIDGGSIVLHPELTGTNWADIATIGNFIGFYNFTVRENGVTSKKLSITGSSTTVGKLYVRNCSFPDGDDGSVFDINLATSSLGCYVDIKHGPYVREQFVKYNTVYDPASLADGAGAAATTTGSTIAELVAGDIAIPSFSADIQGMILTGGVYQAQGLAARFQNETGGTIDLGSSNLSWRIIESKEVKARASGTYDMPLTADGVGVTTTLPVGGAQLGDFVVWSHTTATFAKDIITTAYVSAADVVTIHMQNESGGPTDPASGTLKVALLREETADYINAEVYDPPNLADGVGTEVAMSIPGVELGDFVIPSFSLDLQSMIVTADVTAANVVKIRFQNETGAALDLASGNLKVMVYRNSL